MKLIVSVTLLLCHCACAFTKPNNVCRTFNDYLTIVNNRNCWYNYAVDHDIGPTIRHFGYPFEEHTLTTKDGYILKIHRIPNDNHPQKKQSTIYLHHGFSSNSFSWILLLNESLAFNLADNGYDVWMANIRGNVYSSGHIKLNTNNQKFWKYSLDEVVQIDTPLVLNYITNVTQKVGSIIYIGHSMGTAVGAMYASEFSTEAAELIKFMILMGPGVSVPNTNVPLKPLAPLSGLLSNFLQQFNLLNLASNGEIHSIMFKIFCENMFEVCMQFVNVMFLGAKTGMKPEIAPLAFKCIGQGGSLLMMEQTINTIEPHAMRKYNYGPSKNKLLYGSSVPPSYHLENIKVPTHIIASQGDILTTVADANELYNNLPKAVQHGLYIVPSKKFNHIDFVAGKEAQTLINEYILNLLKEFE